MYTLMINHWPVRDCLKQVTAAEALSIIESLNAKWHALDFKTEGIDGFWQADIAGDLVPSLIPGWESMDELCTIQIFEGELSDEFLVYW